MPCPHETHGLVDVVERRAAGTGNPGEHSPSSSFDSVSGSSFIFFFFPDPFFYSKSDAGERNSSSWKLPDRQTFPQRLLHFSYIVFMCGCCFAFMCFIVYLLSTVTLDSAHWVLNCPHGHSKCHSGQGGPCPVSPAPKLELRNHRGSISGVEPT